MQHQPTNSLADCCKSVQLNKTRAAVLLGKLGGAKGGPARAEALSAQRRSEIASMGAAAAARSRNAQNKKKKK